MADRLLSPESVLAEHRYKVSEFRCKCMGYRDENEATISSDEHAAHQIDALKAAGYRIVASEIVDRAESLAAIAPAPWTFQSWGEQNQNGDYAESILFDSDGETIVYGLGDEDGAFILGAQKVVLDLAADAAEADR